MTGTVVVVPGLGSTPAEWDDVVRALPDDVAVLVVDPAAAPPLRRRADWSPDAVAARLADRIAGTAAPRVLVGHSSGALHVQALLYAGADVAGAVLVDGSHEAAVRLAPERLSALGRRVADLVLATGVPTWLGPRLRRLGVRVASTRRRDRLTPAAVRAVYGSRAWASTTVDAWFGHGPLQAGILAWQRDRAAPAVPVRLLVGAAGVGSGRWVATQHDLAVRLGAPPPRRLDDAGHLVHLDRPDAVTGAIRALLG